MPELRAKGKQAGARSSPAEQCGNGDVSFSTPKNEADLDKYKGQLKGKIVLISPTCGSESACSKRRARGEMKRICWRWRMRCRRDQRRWRRRWRRWRSMAAAHRAAQQFATSREASVLAGRRRGGARRCQPSRRWRNDFRAVGNGAAAVLTEAFGPRRARSPRSTLTTRARRKWSPQLVAGSRTLQSHCAHDPGRARR